ncbi:histidine phosphatase family protein [Paenibacillus sp. J5C_2022]|uniref:histidine phosphatase family protein n=1 Tax=Paenibacillus sp. J5C2022 TaxID=2977129 RepID=UPI0021D0A38F|nr:histidine phosphatase family protein [Paenibacillus sp. J5C2022]MCU6708340.1 histidine phosphatase family protein [Paenibacillus sp. J5C2022]
MLIGFVRHGQTDWNANGIIQGQTDIPLNKEGFRQAKAVADRLSEDERIWDYVISSDLRRARATAEEIASALHIPLMAPATALRERHFGQAEGTTESERIARWGPNWRKLDLGIETSEQIVERGRRLLDGLDREAGNVLIVTHGSFIAEMLLSLCPRLQDERLGNVSYSILQRVEEGWGPLLHNCTKHLNEQ